MILLDLGGGRWKSVVIKSWSWWAVLNEKAFGFREAKQVSHGRRHQQQPETGTEMLFHPLLPCSARTVVVCVGSDQSS